MNSDEEFSVRPGRTRDSGAKQASRGRSLVGQVLHAARRSGHTSLGRAGGRQGGTGQRGRGRSAALGARRSATQRRVVVKARIVRHKGTRFRSAPLARHLDYLERDGVTRDKARGQAFDASGDHADGDAFVRRCESDRHHFRFIVSPEDAAELTDLRTFTRELLADMARDLGTRLDWVAVDHWNTANPHVHILLRGCSDQGDDLVIDRDYIRSGMRARAEERVTVELGPRNEREIQRALVREVAAERWTGLDRQLSSLQERDGLVDLRPGSGPQDRFRRALLIGRAGNLERMGLARAEGTARWVLSDQAEPTLRELELRGDIIKTIHRAMQDCGRAADLSHLAIHRDNPAEPVIGRLIERGLHDELTGTAYALVEGTDGRTHHLRFADIEATGDAARGAIVELRAWPDRRGRTMMTLAVRCDFTLGEQVTAQGVTWLDRQLVAREPVALAGRFGQEVREALEARARHLAGQGLATRQGQGIVASPGLLETLRERELASTVGRLTERTGLTGRANLPGDHVAGIYRERVTLVSGRFAMIESGPGFQLVPWQPGLERHHGQAVVGTVNSRGGVDWSFQRSRGLSL